MSLLSLWLAATLVLTGCNKTTETIETPETNVGIANPASVFCEENDGILEIETDEEGNQGGICKFDDGSYCEEWSFYRGECDKGEIIYNTIRDDEETTDGGYRVNLGNSELYSEEDLSSAVSAIMDTFNNAWEIKCEMKKIEFLGDKKATSELDYCKSLDETVEECVVFTTDFHIPDTDQPMAGAFEPNIDINGYQRYLGRTTGGEWKVLTWGY